MSDKTIICCANCGKGEECSGDLKLCVACKMVKYCNRDCQIAHRPEHKTACKKRAAELHDKALFKHPPPVDDCPICMVRLPLIGTGSKYMSCCGKTVCSGCIHAMDMEDIERDKKEEDLGACAFCRTPSPFSKEGLERMNKRVDLGDAEAMSNLGFIYSEGRFGLPQDHEIAFQLWQKAANLGHPVGCYNLGAAYYTGRGVQVNEKKSQYYYELAAMKGNALARYNIGCAEYREHGNGNRCVKHMMIAVAGGHSEALDRIQDLVLAGDATKDDYLEAMRLGGNYLDEIRSHKRDEAAAFRDDYTYY